MEIIDIIKERLSIFKNLYDSIRIVDPINKRVLSFQEDNAQMEKENCHILLETDEYCKNCISMRAYIENDTFIKMEFVQGEILIITATPVTVENSIYIIEMIKSVSQAESIMINGEKTYNIENLLKKMSDAAISDALTGMYNRRYINENLIVDINNSMKYNQPLCVVMADLDHFKNVNDTYGHIVGDWILKDFAKLLSTSVRSNLDWVGRYGGEEFIIVLRNIDGNNAFNVIEKIRRLVEEKDFTYNKIKIKITASFGAYSIMGKYPIINKKFTIDEIINEADKNLYLSKKSGRNKTVINLEK